MSILLEALRKSERNQQPQEVPTIHDDDQAALVAEPLKVAPLAMLLVAALLISGSLVWRQYRAPAGGYQPPVTLESVPDRRVAQTGQDQQKAEAGGLPATTQSSTAPQNAASGNRTPVESFKPPAKSVAQAKTPQAKNTADGGAAKPAAGGIPSKTAPEATAPKSKPKPKPKPKAKATTTAKPARPAEPAPISYWELPDAIRASVPEIKFSVLVYANDPADRFVLINGERLGEGDTLASGPVVKEIRREGVVFTYRLYQFLVER